MADAEQRYRQAAERLRIAAETGIACAPVRDLIAAADDTGAYRVQWALASARSAAGARIVGRKIGMTSLAAQQKFGVDQPDYGFLFDIAAFVDPGDGPGATVPPAGLIQPKVEPEIAFVLGEDLPRGPFGIERVRGAVEWVVPALEVVDSRIRAWDITFVDTVADNGSGAAFVLGADRTSIHDVSPKDTRMSITVNGSVVATGSGAATLGDPLAALSWLAEAAVRYGHPLTAGEIVLSGALGPMHTLAPGDHVVAEMSGLGRVAMTFGPATAGRGRAGGDASDAGTIAEPVG